MLKSALTTLSDLMRMPHCVTACITALALMGECRAAEPNGSWITFLSHRSGGNLLYRMRPDGGDVTPIFGGEVKGVPGIPDGRVYYREPHFGFQSPDGKYFLDWALDVSMRGNEMGMPIIQLHLGRIGGGPTRVIASNSVQEDFAWSPDSKRFVYGEFNQVRSLTGKMIYTPKQFKISALEASTNAEEVVLEKNFLWGLEDWSPDGKKLLFEVSSTLDVNRKSTSLVEFDLAAASEMRKAMAPFLSDENIKAIDSNLRVVAKTGQGERFLGGRYSPDGRRIASAIMRGTADIKLTVIDVNSGESRAIASYPEGLRGPFSWSPDGTEILFCRHLAEYDEPEKMKDGLGIWAIRPDGTNARLITTGWCADWK